MTPSDPTVFSLTRYGWSKFRASSVAALFTQEYDTGVTAINDSHDPATKTSQVLQSTLQDRITALFDFVDMYVKPTGGSLSNIISL